ncbi:hypothetical protein GGX14DRAFT_406608 [Mycena pura]|uniref:Uncharacterized protein n=1 Tax=Mycena pura TaxID=153505 RepID=A0AAD6UX23_9AGAR|nr:hypothetical protein GGX14DRAFT_406608 [Mycena pura]
MFWIMGHINEVDYRIKYPKDEPRQHVCHREFAGDCMGHSKVKTAQHSMKTMVQEPTMPQRVIVPVSAVRLFVKLVKLLHRLLLVIGECKDVAEPTAGQGRCAFGNTGPSTSRIKKWPKMTLTKLFKGRAPPSRPTRAEIEEQAERDAQNHAADAEEDELIKAATEI